MTPPADPTPDRLRQILEQSRTVAVLGAHSDPERPAHFVPDYLVEHGYEVFPVNPRYAGRQLWNRPVVGDLRELQRPVDIVDLFRRAEALGQHLDEILGMRPPPKVVWLQKGIRNDAFASQLRGAGIEVVQDRCMKEEHQSLVG
jgi:predicted CoA-binding protein